MDQQRQASSNNARTIVADTARLLKQNKLTKEDLAKMDKKFREEVTAYAATVLQGEEQVSFNIRPKEKPPLIKDELVQGMAKPEPKPEPKPIPPPPPPPPPKPVEQPKPVPPPVPPPPKPEPKPVPPPPKPEPKPAPAPTAPLTEEQLLQVQQDDIRKKREIVGKSLRDIQFERNVLLKQLESIRAKEKVVEQDETTIKKEEVGAPANTIRALEEKRWALEDKRQLVEKERWEIHKKLDMVDARISDVYKQQSVLENEEMKIRGKIEVIVAKREALLAESKKTEEEKIYASIQAKKKKFEADWIRMKEDIKHFRMRVEESDARALQLKKQVEEIEKLEGSAINEPERHALEQKRWALDAELRDIEKMVWQIDTELNSKSAQIEEIEKVFAEIQLAEESSKEKLAAYLLTIKRSHTDRNS